MGKQVGLVSLGCAKNQVDSEVLLASLRKAGFDICEDVEQADAVIINTCGFIESAKRESIDEILSAVGLKKHGRLRSVVVTGCLAERYQKEIMQEIPEVDAVVGIGANGRIAELLDRSLNREKVLEFPDKHELQISGDRMLSTPDHYAYLKISEGCSNRCSYCAIPLIRGRFRSRTIGDIAQEAEKLAENGARELILIGQDVTMYGRDLYGKLALADLLNRLCEIPKVRWIRLLYCYPNLITDELLDTMASQEKILHYIDLPLQHCSRSVLRRMYRGGSREELTELIRKMRTRMPDLVLRTTFITGFPGETQEEFEDLAEFAHEIRFDRMGCFPYSREEDTPAAEFPDQVDEDIKQERASILMEQQMQIMQEIGESQIGEIIEVLTEGFDEETGMYVGRSRADSPDVDGWVWFSAEEDVDPGTFVKIRITECIDCDLTGEMVEKEDV